MSQPTQICSDLRAFAERVLGEPSMEPCSHCGVMTRVDLLEDMSVLGVGRLTKCCPVCVEGVQDELAEEERDEREGAPVVFGFVGGR